MTTRIILTGMLMLVWIGSSFGATYTITEFGDDNVVNGNCTLREAIRAANTNTMVDACGAAGSASQADRIHLLAGTYTLDLSAGTDEDNAVDGDLDVLGELIIQGVTSGYTVIDGVAAQSVERVFDLQAGADLVLRDLTISGGNALAASGGNIRLTDSTLEMVETVLSDGKAASGGGMAIAGTGTAIVRRSTIRDNQAVDFAGGGISLGTQSSVVLLDTELSGNRANTSGGGAFGGGELTIYRSNINDNEAADGGGVYTNAKCDIQFSLFDGNEAGRGGGISIAADECEVVQSAILNNSASVEGGGFHITASTFVRRSTIAGNNAPVGGGFFSNSAMALLDHVTVANNLGGGGVHNVAGVFTEVALLANNAGGNCSGAPINFSAFNLDDADTCGFNSAMFPNFPNTDPLLGSIGDHGGPTPTIPLLAGSPAIDAVSTEIQAGCQNSPDQRGYPRGRPRAVIALTDVYFCDIGAYEVVAPHVVDSTVDEADLDPADDRCLTATGVCSLRAAVDQANSTPGFEEIVLPAGTFGLTGGPLELLDPVSIRGAGARSSIVDGNQLDRVIDVFAPPSMLAFHPEPRERVLQDLTVTGGLAAGDGGGIRATLPLELSRAEVTDNSSDSSGGGVYCHEACWLAIRDSEVAFNQAAQNGGGLFQTGDGTALVERGVFSGNGAALGAAGESNRLRLKNTVVHANVAVGSTGAFFAQQAVIEDSTIGLNQADSDTGGFFLLSRSVIRNSIVAENSIAGGNDNCTFNSLGLASLGHNLSDTAAGDCVLNALTDQVSTPPMFADLAYAGGSQTVLTLLPASPAIDRGDDADCPATDRLGVARPQDGDGDTIAACDIGAYESLPASDEIFSDGFEDSVP